MNVPWYLSRSAGLSAYLVLYLVVVLGLSIRTRGLDRYVARWRVTDIHIFLSVLALGLVFLHAGVLLWDEFVGYSLKDILLPYSTGYRTFWTATGIATMYLLVVITVSFPARRFIGYRAWRTLHYGTFGAYLLALAHGIFTGTDSSQLWAQAVYATTAASVLGLFVYRLVVWKTREDAAIQKAAAPVAGATPGQLWRRQQAAALAQQRAGDRALKFGAGAVGVTAFLFVAAGLGPFGWIRSSNSGHETEAEHDDESSAVARVPATSTPAASSAAGQGFRDSFSGTGTQTQSGNQVDIRVRATASGEKSATVDVHLTLVPGSRGRATATANSFTLSDNAGAFCSGEVQRLDDGELLANCLGSGTYAGQQLALRLTFDGGLSGAVSGSLEADIAG